MFADADREAVDVNLSSGRVYLWKFGRGDVGEA